jgi:putative transposase
MGKYLMAVLKNIVRSYPEIEIIEMNTDMDHIHLLTMIPPKMAVSDAVRILKTNSTKALRQRFPFLKTMYEHSDVGIWSDGYFVTSSGIDAIIIQRYIQRQGLEDKGQAKLVFE